MNRNRTKPAMECPDLPSQLEGLRDAVWIAEANWRFDDRLDLALGVHGPADVLPRDD